MRNRRKMQNVQEGKERAILQEQKATVTAARHLPGVL